MSIKQNQQTAFQPQKHMQEIEQTIFEKFIYLILCEISIDLLT